MKYVLIILIHAYRIILRPFLLGECRFQPTCSVYAEESVRKYGAARGSWLALRRLWKCHPFHAGGYDPVV